MEGGLCKPSFLLDLVCDQICQPSNEDEDEMNINSHYQTLIPGKRHSHLLKLLWKHCILYTKKCWHGAVGCITENIPTVLGSALSHATFFFCFITTIKSKVIYINRLLLWTPGGLILDWVQVWSTMLSGKWTPLTPYSSSGVHLESWWNPGGLCMPIWLCSQPKKNPTGLQKITWTLVESTWNMWSKVKSLTFLQVIYPPAHHDFSFVIGAKSLKVSLKEYKDQPEYQSLMIMLKRGADPDDAYSQGPYEKGANFILHLGMIFTGYLLFPSLLILRMM